MDKDEIQKIENREMKRQSGEPVKIAHAIEIKTECGKSGKNLKEFPKKDIKKLKKIAEEEKRSLSNMITYLIERY